MCHVRSILSAIIYADGYIFTKKQELREFRPGYGQDTRSLITYQLYFPEISELGAISWIGYILHTSVQKYDVLSNISQATHLLVQFTSGHNKSRVPSPYTVHGAQYLHAHGKGCSEGGNGGGGVVEGEGVFTAAHFHPLEEHLSRNDGGG